jgi:hypothetical protein
MATLWTFGDSMTFGHGCRPDGPLLEYYTQYKKNDNDLIWPVILANELGYELNNLGHCGASNDYIFDTIISNYHLISENDIVIVNKTFSHRFDIPSNTSPEEFYTICGEIEVDDKRYTNPIENREEYETILNFAYYFSGHKVYRNRHEKRYDFLKSIIKSYKYFEFYTWRIFEVSQAQTINDDTNGKIKDYHLSFLGHRQFANYIYASLFDKHYNKFINSKKLF